MADAKTLDERLRAAALMEVRKELNAKISAVLNYSAANSGVILAWTRVRVDGGSSITVEPFLKAAVDAYITTLAIAIGDKAVQEFLTKVDSLSQEVGEIRNMVEDLPRE